MKDIRLQIRVSEDQLEFIKELSKVTNKPYSVIIRDLLINHSWTIKDDSVAFKEMRKNITNKHKLKQVRSNLRENNYNRHTFANAFRSVLSIVKPIYATTGKIDIMLVNDIVMDFEAMYALMPDSLKETMLSQMAAIQELKNPETIRRLLAPPTTHFFKERTP